MYNKQGKVSLKKSKALAFGICCVSFYGLGTFSASALSMFDGFCYVFCPSVVNLTEMKLMFGHLMFTFAPLILIFSWGYSFLGTYYSLFVISLRAYCSGASCFSMIRELYHTNGGIFVFAIYTILEGCILLNFVSGGIEQKRFRYCYTIAGVFPFKFMLNRVYVKNFLFRYGIVNLIYLAESLVGIVL